MKHNHPVPIEEAIQYPQATHLSAGDDSRKYACNNSNSFAKHRLQRRL